MNAAHPRDAVALPLISAAFFSAPQFAAAQTYPNRTVRIVDVFPPGGGTDVVGRVLAAMLSPARIPADIVIRLNAELQKAVAQSDVRERFAAAGVEPGTSSPDELAAILKNEIAKWSKVIKDAGIRAD